MFRISASFWRGFSRMSDLYAMRKDSYGYSDGFLKDRKALESDWSKIGNNLYDGIKKYHDGLKSSRY